ncbi:RAVE subunit 2/Rogdi [Chytriomyces cf. hyalinus JEL632]|nr:RAVE subunit 2/Rogdi [Chytriomyces cf. hyalinus JEL632]
MTLSEDSSREFKWLLLHRLPSTLQRIAECSRKSVQSASGKGPQTLPITSANSDAVKGIVVLDGAVVVKADLTLRLPSRNSATPIRIGVSPTPPFILTQLSSFVQTVSLALDKIEMLSSLLTEARECDTVHEIDASWLIHQFSDISNFLKSALTLLRVVDEEKLFPLRENDGKMFSPELPDDLIVELYVTNVSTLAVSVYSIGYQPNTGIPLQIQSQILSRFKNMKIEKYKGKPIEIMDEFYLESKIPNLANLEADMTAAIALVDATVKLVIALM